MQPESISVLGCGWLGLPLGKHLSAKGYRVRGSTTTQEKLPLLEESGIRGFHLTLDPELKGEGIAEFLDSEILIVNIPPGKAGREDPEHHPRQIKSLMGHLRGSSVRWVIYVSSTSVYPSLNRRVTEEDAAEEDAASVGHEAGGGLRRSGKGIRRAEELLLQEEDWDTTVLRLCGLYGPNRNVGRFLAGRSEVGGGDAPVNLIHLHDVIGIIEGLIEKNLRGEVYNGCSDGHPTRRELYTLAAERMGLEPPRFRDEERASWKVVDSEKVKADLNYRFRHPDPLQSLE